VSAVVPDDGATLPVNGVVVVRGGLLEAERFQLHVDGTPVATEVVERFTAPQANERKESIGLRPVQRPAVGATLELLDCTDDCQVIGSWVLGEEDDVPPAPLSLVQLGFTEFSHCGGNSCMNTIDRVADVRAEGNADEPTIVSVRVLNTQEPSEELYLRLADELPVHERFPLADSMSPGAEPLASVCVEVRVFDLAGNEAEYALGTCSPCHANFEADVAVCETLEPPEWTDADLLPSGDCSGTPLDALPPLPAPLDPRDPGNGSTGATGEGSSSGEDTSGGGSTTGGSASGGSTTSPPETTNPTDPSGATTGGDSSASEGGAAAYSTGGGGCHVGDRQPHRGLWLALLAALGVRRRRR